MAFCSKKAERSMVLNNFIYGARIIAASNSPTGEER
jgi:hypothetical protein